MRRTALVIVFAGLMIAAPRTARADGYLAPAIGVNFANESARGRADFVVDLGWLPRREPIGVELDVTYAPSFFGNQGAFGQNSVTTVMGNVVVAGGSERLYGRRGRGSVRPYLSGGLGVLRETVTTPIAANTIANSDLGVNLGVGVMSLTRRNVGVRADLRYFRDLVDHTEGNTTNIDFGAFHFWRASIGIVIGF